MAAETEGLLELALRSTAGRITVETDGMLETQCGSKAAMSPRARSSADTPGA